MTSGAGRRSPATAAARGGPVVGGLALSPSATRSGRREGGSGPPPPDRRLVDGRGSDPVRPPSGTGSASNDPTPTGPYSSSRSSLSLSSSSLPLPLSSSSLDVSNGRRCDVGVTAIGDCIHRGAGKERGAGFRLNLQRAVCNPHVGACDRVRPARQCCPASWTCPAAAAAGSGGHRSGSTLPKCGRRLRAMGDRSPAATPWVSWGVHVADHRARALMRQPAYCSPPGSSRPPRAARRGAPSCAGCTRAARA